MFMIMTDNEKTTKTPVKNGADLRDSIVQRLKAHDAAIKSTLTSETPKTTPSKNQ